MFSPISVEGQGITNVVLVLSEINCTLLKERLKSGQNYPENQPLWTPERLISRTRLKMVVEPETLAYYISLHNHFVYQF